MTTTPLPTQTDPASRLIDLRLGYLQVRLAESKDEIQAAQELRYRVFYDEMSATPSPEMRAAHRDFDRFDDVCDHLLVIDHSETSAHGRVVGTYRLIRRPMAEKLGGFYSASEYSLGPLLEYPGELLELGRSCVDIAYRKAPTMQLLWRGIAAYMSCYEIGLMFGCASLPGIDPEPLALQLSYLYYYHLAPPALRPKALASRYVNMQFMDQTAIEPRVALSQMPALIKGYLRVGAFVGDGAVVDEQFGTTDVCIIVTSNLITEKYARHYDVTPATTSFADAARID